MRRRAEQPSFWKVSILPVAFIVVSIPLALKLVPPNHIYGIRTSATLATEGGWYAANAAAGLAGIILGILTLGADWAILRTDKVTREYKVLLCLFIALAAIAGAIMTGTRAI